MEILKIISIGLITAIIAVYLKATKPELAFAVTISGAIIILILIFESFENVFNLFKSLGEQTGIDGGLIIIILKIIGVGYLVEFSAGVIEDFGSKNISDKLVFAGKIVILTLSIPIIQNLITLISKFLEFV